MSQNSKSSNIQIPSKPLQILSRPPTQTTYCYIKADKDHHDLEDLFGGKYIKSQEVWRFDKNKEQDVYAFLDCSSTESEQFDDSSENDNNSEKNDKVQKKYKRRDRLHRANSFNASDDSNDECDSFDNNFRRPRIPKEKIIQISESLKQESNPTQITNKNMI